MNTVNTAAATNDAERNARKLEMLLAPYGKLDADPKVAEEEAAQSPSGQQYPSAKQMMCALAAEVETLNTRVSPLGFVIEGFIAGLSFFPPYTSRARMRFQVYSVDKCYYFGEWGTSEEVRGAVAEILDAGGIPPGYTEEYQEAFC